MKRGAIIGLILGVVGFVACAPADGETTDIGWHGFGNEVQARVITVEGVRCVVMDGYEMGGIDCDWSDE
jgi:hypothetical protein